MTIAQCPECLKLMRKKGYFNSDEYYYCGNCKQTYKAEEVTELKEWWDRK